ncbi:MAG: hypothetical protein ACRYFS_14015 [Janthinobacterium lividum]
MIQTLQTHRSPRLLAWALSALMAGPILAGLTGCGNKGADTSSSSTTTPSQTADTTAPTSSATPATAPATPQKQGMSKGEKTVIVLAGAALLYYLYKKHQAAQQAQAGTQGSAAQSQLYRSSNGGVYYRDPKDPQKVTWLTAPSQPVSVPASDVQQYAPDYQQYQGQAAPAVPAGQPQKSFTQYDPSLAGSQSGQ